MSLLDYRRRAPGMSWLQYVLVWTGSWFFVRTTGQLLFRFRYEGIDRIPPTGPLLYVGNHKSHLDPPLAGVAARRRPCSFLARESLFDNFLLGAILRFVMSVPVGRAGGISALRHAIAELEAGRSILLFPEGTRIREPKMGRFRGGFMLLVRKTGATVVPVGLDGMQEAWPRGGRPRLWRRTQVVVGDPIPSDQLTELEDEEAIELVRQAVERQRLVARERLRARSNGRYPPAGPDDLPYWEREPNEEGDAAEPAPEVTEPSGTRPSS